MRDYSGLDLRTRLFCMAIEATLRRRPVESKTLPDIQAERAARTPAVAPFTWVTGPVLPQVGITYGTAPARDGYEIPLRLYRPRAIRDVHTDVPVIMWFHGGGWAVGNVVDYDPVCSYLAEQVGAVVVSVDYRLAPEHQAPCAAYDCIDATRWVAAHGKVLRADTARLAVAGDSAGGNLAAVVAQQLAGEMRIASQVLVYPATDLTLASPSLEENARGAVLSLASVHAYRAHYLPTTLRDEDPLVSPLFGDVAGVAPALVQTADKDPIRDDGARYAARLREAGVPVRLTNYLGVPHGFLSFPGATRIGAQAREEMVAELRLRLGR